MRPEEPSISFTRAPPRTFLAEGRSSVGARFFDEAEAWTEVPAEIDSPTMEQAMEILHDFRKDTFLTDLYRGRAEAERVERGAQKALERALRAEEEERRLKEEERQQKEEERRQKEEERRQKEAERRLKDDERQQKEAERRLKAAALAEAERLRALLRSAGIVLPDKE